jgi:DNA replication protein DnaC
MRYENDAGSFAEKVERELTAKCAECKGKDKSCACRKRARVVALKYAACIPRDFWYFEEKQITHNNGAYRAIVTPYLARLKLAARRGYGLLFVGDNGTGKTTFTSIVLGEAIRQGYSAYYTTAPQLAHNLKRAFDDKEAARRLDWHLEADFLAIDELTKEGRKPDSWFAGQIERILKTRYDERLPTVLAANTGPDEIALAYGATIRSMLDAKFRQVELMPGDFRQKIVAKMEKEMGYE